MRLPILMCAIFLLSGCGVYIKRPPEIPSEFREPCKAPVWPADGKHGAVEAAGIANASELRICAAKVDALNAAIDRRDKLAD